MAQEDFHVAGLKELDQTLSAFPAKLARKVLRRAMSQGGKVIRVEMVRRTPRREAEPKKRKAPPTYKNIRQSLRFQGRKEEVLVKVGPNKKVAFKAGFNEFGTSHQPPRPFLRPAWEGKKHEALDKITQEMRAGTEKAALEAKNQGAGGAG